jgi:hypothetical protein
MSINPNAVSAVVSVSTRGCVGRDDAVRLARRHVDVVVAHRDVRDDLQLRPGSVEELPVDPLGEQRQHRIGAGDQAQRLLARDALRVLPGAHLVLRAQLRQAHLGNPVGHRHNRHVSPRSIA